MVANVRTAFAFRGAGEVTLAVGLIFIAAGVEALAVFNACVADPGCLPDASGLNVGAFFAILTVGIVLAVIGARILEVTRKDVRAFFP
jgi:prolipoprotein diacylglyceryltransferase